MLFIEQTAIPDYQSSFRRPTYAIFPAKTQASLLIEEVFEYQSVRNRKSTIEPPPSRAQDSKIALGIAGPPKVLHNLCLLLLSISFSTTGIQSLDLRELRT